MAKFWSVNDGSFETQNVDEMCSIAGIRLGKKKEITSVGNGLRGRCSLRANIKIGWSELAAEFKSFVKHVNK